MDNKFIEKITPEAMPNEALAELASYDINAAHILLEKFAGCTIYIPNNGLIKVKEDYIRKNFDGSTKSIRKLAQETNLTEQTVRNILGRTNYGDDKVQLNIF